MLEIKLVLKYKERRRGEGNSEKARSMIDKGLQKQCWKSEIKAEDAVNTQPVRQQVQDR